MIDPDTTYIDKQVRIGRDTVIHPFSVLKGRCEIGEGGDIGPHAHITDSIIGPRSHTRFCCIDNAKLGADVTVGPYTSIRPGCTIGDKVRVGTFVEVTRSEIGDNSDILHLSYIGDAHIGQRCSIGTGSVTVNFDGKRKRKTTLGDDVFLGSKTSLVAPLQVDANMKVPHNAVLSGEVKNAPPAKAPAKAKKKKK